MSAIIEFLSKLWSPRSNNRGSRSDSQRGGGKEKLAITGLLSRRKKPAGGYFISSVGQRQNDAIREKKKKGAWAFFFLPTPHFKPPEGDFPPARKAPTPDVEMLGLIYVGVTVFGLGSDCFAQSKSR